MTKINTLALSNLLRHAFLRGTDRTDWAKYEPPEELYKQVEDAIIEHNTKDTIVTTRTVKLKLTIDEIQQLYRESCIDGATDVTVTFQVGTKNNQGRWEALVALVESDPELGR